jgi:uracil-DNA glycosylase
VLVCLGATAARAVLGKITKISEHRGELLESDLGSRIVVTVHPSSILRIEDSDMRQVAMRHFIDDLRTARRAPIRLQGMRTLPMLVTFSGDLK